MASPRRGIDIFPPWYYTVSEETFIRGENVFKALTSYVSVSITRSNVVEGFYIFCHQFLLIFRIFVVKCKSKPIFNTVKD